MPPRPLRRNASAAPPLDCARRLLATVPPLMREIRAEMRGAAPEGLTVPQFRVLIFTHNHPGASVTELAAHLGVSVPTASVAVDRLVRLGLLEARQKADNRRRRALMLTRSGAEAVADAMASTADSFARRLARLSEDDLALVQQAMTLLDQHVAAQPRSTAEV